MIKLSCKPETTTFYLCGFPLFRTKQGWHTLHLNGLGYYGILVDGRSVYGEAKKQGKIDEYKNFKII